MKLENLNIDNSWALFLDRDGVINTRLPDAYVRSAAQFKFIEGVPEAISMLSGIFGTLIVVTNQQGIGKGLMTETDLEVIHHQMVEEVKKKGGRIDKIYYSPYLESSGHIDRKPSVGMALKARKDFREIRFSKSVMVGDSVSDLIFGKRLKMITVYIGKSSEIRFHPHLADFIFPDLLTFAREISLKPFNA